MMKKIVCFISLLFLSLSFISCTKEENEIKDPTNNNDTEQDTKEIEFITINNLEDFYFIGEEGNLSITVYPNDVVINNIKYETSDDNIISIDNNGHLETKNFGKCIITITVNNKEEKRIVEVVGYGVSQGQLEEWEEYRKRVREENERIAKENGFDSYSEYMKYLEEERKKQEQLVLEEKQQRTRGEAEALGLSVEDYLSIVFFGKSFDEMNKDVEKYGSTYVLRDFGINEYGWELRIDTIDEIKFKRLYVIALYIDEKLGYYDKVVSGVDIYGSCSPKLNVEGKIIFSYGSHYFTLLLCNYGGKKIDKDLLQEIEEVLPEAEYYVRMYDYLVEKYDVHTCMIFIQEKINGIENQYLLNEIRIEMEEYLKEYNA